MMVGSVRTYTDGTRSYRVVTVGTGSHLSEPDTTALPVPESARKPSFNAHIPHHGAVLDVLIAQTGTP